MFRMLVALSLLGLKENVKGAPRFSSTAQHKEQWSPTPKHWVSQSACTWTCGHPIPPKRHIQPCRQQEEICPGGLRAAVVLWEQQLWAGFYPDFLPWRETKNVSGAKLLPHGLFLLQPRGCRDARMLFSPTCLKHKLFSPSHLPFLLLSQIPLLLCSTCSSHLDKLVWASLKIFSLFFCFPAVLSFGGHQSSPAAVSLGTAVLAPSLPLCSDLSCIPLELMLLEQHWAVERTRTQCRDGWG